MKWIKRILVALVVLIALAVGLVFVTGNGPVLKMAYGFVFGGPGAPFDPAKTVAAPDYDDVSQWAALPTTADLADYRPAGQSPPLHANGRAPVDVFFIHPTGFLKGDSWIWNMDPNTQTEENTQWMMANQASAYNACCDVYAPRYRQASIFTYFRGGPEEKAPVMRFAYEDVERAFDYFLAHFSGGRPFVIASHSQGTHHGVVLMRERIDGTPLAQRLVAAYLIGGSLDASEFAGMKDIAICDSPNQTGCAVHWDTMSERGAAQPARADNVCVNPLTWKRDGGLAPQAKHVGGMPVSGRFQVQLTGDDAATGMVFPPLGSPVAQHTSARCEDGVLKVMHQDGEVFQSGMGLPGSTNYHGLDYPLFYMDIRRNAELRVATYLGVSRL